MANNPIPDTELADEAMRLCASNNLVDIGRAQVYATLALAYQVNQHGRLLGQIGSIVEKRVG